MEALSGDGLPSHLTKENGYSLTLERIQKLPGLLSREETTRIGGQLVINYLSRLMEEASSLTTTARYFNVIENHLFLLYPV